MMESIPLDDRLWFEKIGVIENHLNCSNFTATDEAVEIAKKITDTVISDRSELDETDIYIYEKIQPFCDERVQSQEEPVSGSATFGKIVSFDPLLPTWFKGEDHL